MSKSMHEMKTSDMFISISQIWERKEREGDRW